MSFFGSSNPSGNSNNPPSNLFSGASSNTSTSTPTTNPMFGTKPATGGSLFGNTTSTGTTSLFGANTAAPTLSSGNLFGGSSSAAAPSGSLFGNTASNQNTSNAPTAGVFSLPKPGEQSATPAPKPAASVFGQPGTSSSTTTASGTNLFGLPPKPTEGAGTSTTSSTTGNSLFGGNLFGKPPTTGATAPAAQPSSMLGGNKDAGASTTAPSFSLGGLGGNKDSSTPAAGNLFGGLGAGTKPTEKKDSMPTTTGPGLSLFGAAKADDKKDTPAAPSFLVPSAKEAEKPKDSKDTSTTANIVAVPPPSMLRGKSLEEIVNRWTADLETHVREFSKFAGEVAVWDRALIENGNNLAALYSHVLAAERQQNEIDQSLDHIEQQQRDLTATLDAYEKASNEVLGGQGGVLRAMDSGPADTERDKNYMLASDLHTQLDDLSGSLTQMIESVNALSLTSKPSDANGDDPMAQIAQILSSHLESLQWIDVGVREVEGKVMEVEKKVKESGHTIPNGSNVKSRVFGNNR